MTSLSIALSMALFFTYPQMLPHAAHRPSVATAQRLIHAARRRAHRPTHRTSVMVRHTCHSVRCTMLRAIRLTGAPVTWLHPLLWLAWRESRNNPAAMAQEGTIGGYAEGLMQMLPTTFDAHALPGRTNIWSAVDNEAAAIRYIQNRYGNPRDIPGLGTSAYEGY